jgi:hypothetical protein
MLAGVFVCSVCPAGPVQNDIGARKYQHVAIKVQKGAQVRRRWYGSGRRRR